LTPLLTHKDLRFLRPELLAVRHKSISQSVVINGVKIAIGKPNHRVFVPFIQFDKDVVDSRLVRIEKVGREVGAGTTGAGVGVVGRHFGFR
jgi:hypothetical protein